MKKAVMYGAGNIGRGFIGQLFSQSGYEVYFIDVNPVLIERLNIDRCYPIRVIGSNNYEEILVENVNGVNGADMELVASVIADADIMATAVGVNILPRIALPIAYGLRKRWQKGNFSPLNIIICENMLDANHYLARLVKHELTGDEQRYFDELVGLVEASIGRMVPVMTPEMQEGNPLRVWVEEYSQLPVDRDGFKGEMPAIKNMLPFSPFDFYIQRKLFMHNMGHAATAYLGFLNGYRYIWEAVGNSAIKLIVTRALQESAIAMSEEHEVHLKELLVHADDLTYRFGNKLLGDTIERVGKDPVRKLAKNDRLIGAASLCLKKGIIPIYISLAAAAAFFFHPQGDESAKTIQKALKDEGIENTLVKLCGLSASDALSKLTVEFYNRFRQGSSIEEALQEAERLKNSSWNKEQKIL